MQNIPGKYWNSLFDTSHKTQDPWQNFPISTRLLYGIRNLSQLCYILLVLFILFSSQKLTLSRDCSKQNVQFPDHVSKFLESIYLAFFWYLFVVSFPFIYFISSSFLLPSVFNFYVYMCLHSCFYNQKCLSFIFYLYGFVFLQKSSDYISKL